MDQDAGEIGQTISPQTVPAQNRASPKPCQPKTVPAQNRASPKPVPVGARTVPPGGSYQAVEPHGTRSYRGCHHPGSTPALARVWAASMRPR